jgi:hypothetical protein
MIKSAPGTSIGLSLGMADVSGLTYLIALASAIGGGSSAAGIGMIRAAPATSFDTSVARASAAIILAAQGVSVAASPTQAAASLILAAPAVAMALAASVAPASMILAAPGASIAGGTSRAPAAIIRAALGATSAYAIASALGAAVDPGAFTGPGFSSEGRARTLIINQSMRHLDVYGQRRSLTLAKGYAG